MLLLKSCLEWMKPWSQIYTVPGRKWQPTPLQYFCLGNSMDRGAWWAALHGIKELDTIAHVHTHTHTHTYIYIHTVQKYTTLSLYYIVSQSGQPLSHVRLLATPLSAACQASLSITNSRSLLKLMSIELAMPSNHLILCHPLLLPSIFPSIMMFSNESVLHIRWPKYWSFTLNISPSNEYSALISFTMNWLDLLAVQGALKSLLQHHSSKA